MATAHDSHDQRPARAALRISDCLSHGAVPELLRADETFEPFRGCAGILASGRMLLEPLKQAVSIEGRGRRWITDALPLGDRHGCYALCSNPTIGRPINIECQHRQAMRAGEMEQRQIEFFGEAPDLRPIDLVQKVAFVQFAFGPAVEHGLDATWEHLETEDHVGSMPEQRCDRMKLPPM